MPHIVSHDGDRLLRLMQGDEILLRLVAHKFHQLVLMQGFLLLFVLFEI